MAKVRKVNYDPTKVETGSDFVPHPAPAVVRVKCVTANLEETFKSGNEGGHLIFEIVKKAPGKGKRWAQLHLRYIFSDDPDASWREAEVMDALLGKRVKQYTAAQLTGKVCLAKLREEEYNGEPVPAIKNLLPFDSAEFEEEDDEDAEPDEVEDEDVEDKDEDEDEDEDEGEDDYNDWSLAQLRAELKRRSLPSSGKKDDLVAALEADDEDAEDEEEEEEEDGEDYSEYSRAELAAEVKRRGLKVLKRHTEDDLIAMLEEDDEDDEDPLDDE